MKIEDDVPTMMPNSITQAKPAIDSPPNRASNANRRRLVVTFMTHTYCSLKAFLRGEQWFRRASWDSAMASYDAAIALDSMFPLPLWRSGLVLGWSHEAGDSVSVARVTRAGALTHGLAARDSLRLTADSILAGLYQTSPREPGRDPAGARIADDLTRRYPDDAESWYLPGEARSTGDRRPGARRAKRSRRSTEPSGSTRRSPRPTSMRSTSRSGSTAPRRAIAMPSGTSPSGRRTPPRRASAWRTSSWRARGTIGERRQPAARGVALGPPGRVARLAREQRLR